MKMIRIHQQHGVSTITTGKSKWRKTWRPGDKGFGVVAVTMLLLFLSALFTWLVLAWILFFQLLAINFWWAVAFVVVIWGKPKLTFKK